MASDSLLNVIQGLVKREDRIAKKEDKVAKEKLKLEKEKDDEDEDEAPVGDQDSPETEPDPESEADPEGEAEPAPEPEAEPDPEAEAEPEDDGAGDTKPTGPDPVLVDQVTNAVMGQIMGMLQDAAEDEKAKKDSEIKLSGKKAKVDTKPKMEGRKPERRTFREAIHLSVTDGTPLAEGYESEILQILEDEGIDGPLGYEPFFEKGKLFVEKGSEKKAAKVLKQSKDIRKVPKIVGEENILESLPMEAVEVDARFKGFKEAIKRLTYEKMRKIKEEENKQKKYQAFVSLMLKKFGVESPAELEGDKKKAYFDALDKGWEAEGEKPEPEDKKSEKKNENFEINEASSDKWLAGLATGGAIFALKKAWDKWGKTSSLAKAWDKDAYNKNVIDKEKDDQDKADNQAAADEIEKKKKGEKKEKDTQDAQSKFDQSRKEHGKNAQPPEGYSVDPEDKSGKTVIPTADAEKKRADKKSALDKKISAKGPQPKKNKNQEKPSHGGKKGGAKHGQAGTSAKSQEKARRKELIRKRTGENFIPDCISILSDLTEDFTKEDRTQLLEELVLEETMTLEESNELQAIMALDDVGIKAEINRKGQVVIKKKDKKKAQLAFEKSFKKGGWPPLKLEDSRSAYDIVSQARVRLQESSDANAERELYLFVNNERSLSRQKESIIKNIKQKMKSDRYDHSKAPKLWQYWVDNGAKLYVQEFGGSVKDTFAKDVRQSVAIQFANELQAEIKLELED